MMTRAVPPDTFRIRTSPVGFAARPGRQREARRAIPSIGRGVVHGGCRPGPGSVDAWLAWLVAGEFGVQEPQLLDVDNRQLVLDGQRIDLTPLEFGFLQQLVAQHGRTVTRRELLEKVWGYDHAAARSNVLEAVARSVRRKLGDRAAMLETVRGLGYRMRRVP